MVMFSKKDKKGWVRTLEVFVSIMLMFSLALLIVQAQSGILSTKYKKIYDQENLILRGISINDSLRDDVLNNDMGEAQNYVDSMTPSGMVCILKVCDLNVECILEEKPSGELFVRSSPIFASEDQYSLKELNLFCYDEV